MENQEKITVRSAIQHATENVPKATPKQTVKELITELTGRSFGCSSHIVVCTRNKVEGVLTIEILLAADPNTTVASLMDSDPPVINPNTDQEIAAWKAAGKGESALVIVDKKRNFQGLIPPHQLISILLAEHEEDLNRFGGILKGTEIAQTASREPIKKRVLHRLPWLMLGLTGALAAADMVGWFESQLQMKVILAFFIPGIVYLADAVGTQTETVVVRGLSVGVPMRKMILKEFLTGIIIGILLALVATPLVGLRWNEWEVALSVGVALFAASSLSTVTAMTLPWLFTIFRADPAFGSGPMATVVQDLLSILIYFLVAIAIIQ